MNVDLYCCGRCKLKFVADKVPKWCPKCQWLISDVTPITLVGEALEVSKLIFFPMPNLGARCRHGFLHSDICRYCATNEKES